MSERKTDLRKSLKSLYDDLRDAENGSDRQTNGFKHRLQVIHENLEDMIPRLLAEFPHLGEFSSLGDFEPAYYRLGDSGMDQALKSQIKLLAIEIDANLEPDSTTTENEQPLEIKDSKQKQTKKVYNQKTRDKKRSLTHAEKVWVWENKPHDCNICGKEVEKFSGAHFDHTTPHAKGGKTTPANSGITHIPCNKLKGTKSLKEIQKHLGVNPKSKKSVVKLAIEKNIHERPMLRVVNKKAEPLNQSEPRKVVYKPNFINEGNMTVNKIRIHDKVFSRVVQLEELVKPEIENEIKKQTRNISGSLLPNESVNGYPIEWIINENEISVIRWIEYNYLDKKDQQVIFDARFRLRKDQEVIHYTHDDILESRKDLKSSKRGF